MAELPFDPDYCFTSPPYLLYTEEKVYDPSDSCSMDGVYSVTVGPYRPNFRGYHCGRCHSPIGMHTWDHNSYPCFLSCCGRFLCWRCLWECSSKQEVYQLLVADDKLIDHHYSSTSLELFKRDRQFHLSLDNQAVLYLTTPNMECPFYSCQEKLVPHQPGEHHFSEHSQRLKYLSKTYDINKDNDLPKSGCPFACWLLYWNNHLKRHHWWKKLKEYGWTDYSTEKIATYLRKAYLGGDQTACGYVARMVLNGCGPFSHNEDLAMMILYTLGHPSANLWIAQYLHKKGEVYKCEHELTISLFCQPPSLHSHSFVDSNVTA